jgi:hypothetical protein
MLIRIHRCIEYRVCACLHAVDGDVVGAGHRVRVVWLDLDHIVAHTSGPPCVLLVRGVRVPVAHVQVGVASDRRHLDPQHEPWLHVDAVEGVRVLVHASGGPPPWVECVYARLADRQLGHVRVHYLHLVDVPGCHEAYGSHVLLHVSQRTVGVKARRAPAASLELAMTLALLIGAGYLAVGEVGRLERIEGF